jgi:signal transduction histidine kinase
MLTIESYDGAIFLLFAIFITVAATCVAIWFASQLKKIKRGGEAIANGDFEFRINSRELWPMLRMHAYNLNCAADGMSKAVDDRMKSERFKTELITNVSHDLKTPLTSIVSYVDLLKKENIENENAIEYIEVIDRQSAKLKKLTEDLVEASKATSGAVAVNKETVNIGELINQSVGEFSEKLFEADITPVINIPEEDVFVNTDGRLLWRVFDNLIQNIIKYAQPGTRAYFDLTAAENAVLTIRNISKEPLNMTAEALMERFVRGDASRNSEGNGLGLSIAKSLTELCGGSFELSLDGDLYKVTITLPIEKE